jgi:hypothetical protein
MAKDGKSFTDMQLTAVNYFILKADRKADESSYLQLTELYDWLLQNELIPFHARTFRSMTMTYLQLAWLNRKTDRKDLFLAQANDFMDKHKALLVESEQENAIVFMEAYEDFVRGDYAKVTKGELFKTGGSMDPYYEYGYWFVWLRAEYELGNIAGVKENLRHLKDRLRRRSGLLERTKKTYSNIIRFFSKLIRLRKKKDLEKMAKEIKEAPLLGGRAWFLEKIQEKLDQSDTS